MEAIRSIKVNGRACCAVKDEVWVAQQSGGIAVFSARSGDLLTEVEVKSGGADGAQFTCLTAVFDEVWAATISGEVHFLHASLHSCTDTLRVPGAEKKVQVVQLCFNGHVAVVATSSGSLYLHHPLTHQRLCTLTTSTAPCTAAMQFYSFVVGGDAKGGLYVWDSLSGECLCYHGESSSEVVALLHEPATGTIWVSRANENTDVYTFDSKGLVLRRRVSGVGKVTDMVAVSATVLATTFSKRVVQIDAATAKVMSSGSDASTQHTSFIHGCCKAMHQEVAQVWSIGNDAAILVWRVTGKLTAVVPVPLLLPAMQAELTNAVHAKEALAEGELRVRVQTERQRSVDIVDDLRKSREEAQELRLRLCKKEESCHLVEEKLTAEKKLRKELEERIAKLTKDVTEITSKVNIVERERSTLQGELTQLKTDLSKANTNVNAKQTEKATVEQQLLQEKTNKSILEQRLRDAEAKLASMQAEHRRLCEATGTVTNASALSQDAQEALAKNSTALASELDEARKLHQLMSSAMASMEYTLRRREEEDKDLTALLNAYRRRVADRVSDPHLSALLLATIVRNASRFDVECDAFTRAQLMDHNGPFLQFIQSLRATEPEVYEKLVHFLQSPSATENLNTDTRALLDRVVALAAKEGEVSGEDIVSFKRSIPGFVAGFGVASTTAANTTTTAGTASAAPAAAPAAAAGPTDGAAVAPNVLAALPQGNLSSGSKTGAGGQGNASGTAADSSLSKQDQEVIHNAVIRELRGQQTADENNLREQQALFEFILKTRRMLVESLALMHKRTVSARQVVEALCLNTAAAATPTLTPSTSSPRKSLQPMQTIFAGIIRELDTIATEVVQRYLTAAEKQRLGIVTS